MGWSLSRSALCSGELEGSKIENSVPRKGEVLNEMAPAVKSMAVENGSTDADSNLISQLRERISALEGQLGTIKDSSPAKSPTKSSVSSICVHKLADSEKYNTDTISFFFNAARGFSRSTV